MLAMYSKMKHDKHISVLVLIAKTVSYQKKNVKTALASLQFLSFLNIKKEDIKNGLKKFKTNTSFIGRWQVLKKNPKIILDVSHNFEGFKNIIEQIKNENFERLIFVMGFVKGKNIKQIFSVLPKRAFYFISQPNIDRAYSIEEIKIKLESFSHNIIYSNSLKESYYKALEISLKEDLIVLTGSNFIAQELMDLI